MGDMVSTPDSPWAAVSPAGAHAALVGGAAVVGGALVGAPVVGVAVVDGPSVVDGDVVSVVVLVSTLDATPVVAVEPSDERSLEQAAMRNVTARNAVVRLMSA